MKKILLLSFFSLLTWIVYFLVTTHKDLKRPHYVGEGKCISCHEVQSHSLPLTLHPKIFKPVDSEDEILGNFTVKNSLVKFKKSDIDYVVGSKWEQVYLRKAGQGYYVYPVKWMVSTQKWVPFVVHQKDAVSRECNACHTTGYSRKTGKFNEYGVKCEACHGPASEHVAHHEMESQTSCKICHSMTEKKSIKHDIVLSQKSAVCGQCHTRGTTTITHNGKTTLFNFPLEYLPKQDNNTTFVQSSPKTDKQHKNWWGVGLSKNRHQEFADFSFSKHSKSLINLKTKKNPHGGKKDASCLQCHSEDYRSAKEGEKPTIVEAKLGVTCVTCHEPHGIDKNIRSKKSLDAKCAECHIFDIKTKKHYPCPSSKASCVGCHMPLIAKSGGAYTIRSHAFKIIPPEATKKYNMPSSCQNGACHQDKSVEWAIDAYNSFYKKKGMETLADVIKGAK